MTIKEFYCEAYPTDDLGVEINPKANFADLWEIIRNGNIYEYLGVCDSVIRERVFQKFSQITGHDIDYIYEEWINS